MRDWRLWMKVETVMGKIPVYVVKTLENDDGHDLDGFFDKEKPEILIRQIDNKEAMKSTLHHELLHVSFRGHADSERDRVFKGRTVNVRESNEEAIVSFLEPIQFDLLVRNGWLKYPNPPRVK